jgi:hypothetical protein
MQIPAVKSAFRSTLPPTSLLFEVVNSETQKAPIQWPSAYVLELSGTEQTCD